MGIPTESFALDTIIERRIAEDPYLAPYADNIRRRIRMVDETELRLTGGKTDLVDFSSGHEYFGMHVDENRWVFREWAPNARAIYLKGSFNNWRVEEQFALKKISEEGTWEIKLDCSAVSHKDVYRLEIHWPGGSGDRIPAWARRVVQDPSSLIFNAQVWNPRQTHAWRNPRPDFTGGPLLVYESHGAWHRKRRKSAPILSLPKTLSRASQQPATRRFS